MNTVAARTCRQCGDQLVAADRFCATCGTRVERSCIQCGTMLVSGDRFCPECGTPQEPTGPVAAPPSGFMSVWDSVVRVLRSSLSGEYRITRELGRGGQAAVFQADELALNRQVAIKVLAPGIVNGERDVELFRREAQTIANLTHPHIVTVYSVRQVDDLHLFVMQYIEGRSLAAIIADRGPLPLTTVRAVAFQVGNALQYAHKKGVVHRDIKPANVLFDEEGNAIVTDFGIAKDMTNGTSSTLTGGLLGTPAYMSPEQCNQLTVNWASDQYSMGVMLYEMLTGRVPFEGSTFTVMQGHTDRDPPSIRALRPDCPVELEWAVLRMLEKRPGDRFPAFSEALEALGATPLTRDDPIRGELKRLALGSPTPASSRAIPDGRLTLSVPEQVEVGESATWALYVMSPGAAESLPIPGTLVVADSAVARYDEVTGALVGIAPGRTSVTAESQQGAVTVEVEVIAARVATITLTASSTQLEVGQTLRCQADVRDRRGGSMAVPVTWESSTPSVLAVTREGIVRAVAPGAARVFVRAGELSDERAFVVLEAEAASIVVSSPPLHVEAHESFVLSAQVLDGQGEPLAGRAPQWSSSDRSVADIDAFGVVTTHTPGHVQFVARAGAAQATVSVVVRGVAGGAGIEPPVEPRVSVWADTAASDTDDRPALEGVVSSPSLPPRAPGGGRQPMGGEVEVPAPSGFGKGRGLWAAVAGVVVVGALAIGVLRNRDGATPDRPDPGLSATALARFSSSVPAELDRQSLSADEPSFLDSFDSEPDGLRVVQDTVYKAAAWAPFPAGGFAVHTTIGTPLASTRSAGLLIQTADRTTYRIELINKPRTTALQLVRQNGEGQQVLLNQPELPSRWVGATSLDVMWSATTLRLFINGAPVGAPVEVGAAPLSRVLLFARGAAPFDEVAAVSLRTR